MDFLLFQLYGPMASWGDVAIGEMRPTALHPSRSALLGLIAAALGIRRDEEERHRELGEGLRFAVQVVTSGHPLEDYHTVQTSRPPRKRPHDTRRDQLGLPRHDLQTLLSSRSYRTDALYRVAAWAPEGSPVDLGEIRCALEAPRFVLYLGRKACPPALPLAPRVLSAETLREALETYGEETACSLPALPRPGSEAHLFWEGETGGAFPEATQSTTRRDDPVSRGRWTFRSRREHFA